MWRQPPLIFDFSNGLLYILFVLLYAPWVLMFVIAYPRPAYLRSKLAGIMLAGAAATLMMTYYAVFGGATRLLHYAERQPGETTAIVTAKHAYSRKRCHPSIELDEFRHVGRRLCVGGHFFERVSVGDPIRLTGMMSRYAMEPERFEILVDE
jgi:hypothetical protein